MEKKPALMRVPDSKISVQVEIGPYFVALLVLLGALLRIG